MFALPIYRPKSPTFGKSKLFPFTFWALTNKWIPPSEWTGDLPAVYRSFDHDENTSLMNGAMIVPGMVSRTNINVSWCDSEKLFDNHLNSENQWNKGSKLIWSRNYRPNMAFKLTNELCCIMHCLCVCEQVALWIISLKMIWQPMSDNC